MNDFTMGEKKLQQKIIFDARSTQNNLTFWRKIMSEDKKVEESVEETLTCPGWLEDVDEDLEALHKSPYELEEKRKLSDVETYLSQAVYHLREAVMSLSMEVAHLKNMAETKSEVASPAGKKSMGRKK